MPKSQPGNKHGIKLKLPEIRQKAYKEYCAHIASGYPKQAFFFKHSVYSACWATLDKYIEENPSEFDPHLMRDALAQRFKLMFGEGVKLMKGGYKGGSPVVWQTIMRNMFRDQGWDQAILAGHEKSSVDKMVDQLDGNSH